LSVYFDQKARIYLLKNSNLMADTIETEYGTFIFYPYSRSSEYYGAEFK